MTQFESRKPDIEAAGAQLAFVAAEKRDGVWRPGKFLEKHPISSVFLLDEDRALNIAHPATLVIGRDHDCGDTDRSGLVRYIYRGANQLDRAPLDGVLGALQK